VRRSTQRSMCAAILVLEAIVLFLTGVVTIGTTDLGAGRSVLLGVGLAVLCVVAAGMLGRRGGYPLGWLVQVVSVALGLVVGVMFFIGALFAVLWATAYVLGERIDREKAEREVVEAQWRAQQSRASDA
jgi:CHASE3 domain sensor protein